MNFHINLEHFSLSDSQKEEFKNDILHSLEKFSLTNPSDYLHIRIEKNKEDNFNAKVEFQTANNEYDIFLKLTANSAMEMFKKIKHQLQHEISDQKRNQVSKNKHHHVKEDNYADFNTTEEYIIEDK